MTLPSISIPEPQPLGSLLSLEGRCVVVTGGSRGLGEAIVRRLVEAGAAVVFTGRGREALQRVEAQVTAAGGKAIGVQADARRIEDSRKAINLAVERLGHIDILVNNAAVFPASEAMEMTEEIWDETFETDLKGAFFAAKFAAEAMIAAGHGGRIINVLSTAAFRIASPLVAYGAAEAGLWYVTQELAQELAEHRILVNAVTPGATLTAERIAAMSDGTFLEQTVGANAPESLKQVASVLGSSDLPQMMARMMPLGRTGYPDDIAKAVLFLASDMAAYISGINITVDGGQSLANIGPGANMDNAAAGAGPAETDNPANTVSTESQQAAAAMGNSLEGTYKATLKTPMGSQEVVFVYHVAGAVLTGTVKAAGNTVDIENGTATGNAFAYQYRMKSPIGKVKVQVTGKVEGDKMLGNLKTPMGNIAIEGTRV